MLYPKEKINEFKGNLKTSLQEWAELKIDDICQGKPTMQAASVYMKRGLNNYLEREDEHINKAVDNALMFVTNKDGGIDSSILVEDLVGIFKVMDKQKAQLGPFLVEYGKGELLINIPHNFIFDMIFGQLGKVHLTAADILELKDLL